MRVLQCDPVIYYATTLLYINCIAILTPDFKTISPFCFEPDVKFLFTTCAPLLRAIKYTWTIASQHESLTVASPITTVIVMGHAYLKKD